MSEIYEQLGFKTKEELEEVYTGIISADTGQSDARAEIRDITKLPSINENADLFSVMLRLHLRHGRPASSFIHKRYKDQTGEKAKEDYEYEKRNYAFTNEVKPTRYGFAHQRELIIFPKCYFDNPGKLAERRSLFLQDITVDNILMQEDLQKTEGKLIWEGIAPALDPMILLSDLLPSEAFYKNFQEKYKMREYKAGEFAKEISDSVNNLFEGGILPEGSNAAHNLSARYITCEERENKEEHLTIVKKKVLPSDSNTLSLIDSSDIVYATRMLPLGSLFLNPDIYNRTKKNELVENIYESYFRRRNNLSTERNIGKYSIPLDEFSPGVYLGGIRSNMIRASFLFDMLPNLDDESKEKIKTRIKNLEEACLEQTLQLSELPLPEEESKLSRELYHSFLEATKHSKV